MAGTGEDIKIGVKFVTEGLKKALDDVKKLKSRAFTGLGAEKKLPYGMKTRDKAMRRNFRAMMKAEEKLPDPLLGRIRAWERLTGMQKMRMAMRDLRIEGGLLNRGNVALNNSFRRQSGAMFGLNWASEKLRKSGRQLTMSAMSMLGVFFGGFTTLRMFRRGAELLLRPLADINMAMETLGKAIGFAKMTDLGPLQEGFKEFGEVTIPDIIDGWKNLTAIMEQFKYIAIVLATRIFTNQEVIDSLSKILDILYNNIDKIIGIIEPLIVGVVKFMAAMLESKGGIMDTIEGLRDLLNTLLKVGLYVLKPIVAFLGLGDVLNVANDQIEQTESSWGKLGIRIAAFTSILGTASMGAMFMLPLLSLIQASVMAMSGAFKIASITGNLLAFVYTLLTGKVVSYEFATKSAIAVKMHDIAVEKIKSITDATSTFWINMKAAANNAYTASTGGAIVSTLAMIGATIQFTGATIAATIATHAFWAAISLGLIPVIILLVSYISKVTNGFKDWGNAVDEIKEDLNSLIEKIKEVAGYFNMIYSLASIVNRLMPAEVHRPATASGLGTTTVGGSASVGPGEYTNITQNVNIGVVKESADVDEVSERLIGNKSTVDSFGRNIGDDV